MPNTRSGMAHASHPTSICYHVAKPLMDAAAMPSFLSLENGNAYGVVRPVTSHSRHVTGFATYQETHYGGSKLESEGKLF